ncbi:MAG: hypothetical protein ACT4OZ_10790 [Gemmatimonadota bacterium]
MADQLPVPVALQRWFVVHFVADIAVALPLFLAPEAFLRMFGWTEVDPAMSRVVAAALFAIGIQSFIGRNEPRATYLAMLNLKVLWSTFAVGGILLSIVQGAPAMAWLFLLVFLVFSAVWWRYWVLLRRS